MNCLVCDRKELVDCFPEYIYCTNCFHIQKRNLSSGLSIDRYYTKSFKDFLLKKIDTIDWSNKSHVNVLVVNDINTELIDSISDTLLQSVSRYRLTTVSLSSLYNGSFFSRHKHNKLSLSDYTSDILKNEYGHFDLIILNDTLTYANDPNSILNSCKKLCKDTTIIMSINIHTCILSSMNVLLLDNRVNNIFNTNSLKTLCKRSRLQLANVINYNNWMISIILGCEETSIEEVILDKLYNEITCNLYDKHIYEILNNYWTKYLSNINDVLQTYRTVGHKLIQISDLPEGYNYFNITYDKHIVVKDLQHIDKIIKDIVEKESDKSKDTDIIVKDTDTIGKDTDNYVVVILNYENSPVIRDTIKMFSKKSWLYFDLYYLIAYNL